MPWGQWEQGGAESRWKMSSAKMWRRKVYGWTIAHWAERWNPRVGSRKKSREAITPPPANPQAGQKWESHTSEGKMRNGFENVGTGWKFLQRILTPTAPPVKFPSLLWPKTRSFFSGGYDSVNFWDTVCSREQVCTLDSKWEHLFKDYIACGKTSSSSLLSAPVSVPRAEWLEISFASKLIGPKGKNYTHTVYVSRYVYVHMDVCVYVYVCICVDTYVYLNAYTHMHMCVYVCICMFVCVYIQMFVCMYLHVCVFMYVYIPPKKWPDFFYLITHREITDFLVTCS